MLFKRRSTERKPSDSPSDSPSVSPPESPSPSAEADDDGGHRSLGSLIEGRDRSGQPKLDRYHAMLAMMEREGGARTTASKASGPSGFQYTVESGKQSSEAPRVEIRFSKREPAAEGMYFELQVEQAQNVEIAFDCNDWRPEPMVSDAEAAGRWSVTKALPRGEFRYKFIVDGQWMNDPLNPFTKPNPFGSVDSIVRVSSGP